MKVVSIKRITDVPFLTHTLGDSLQILTQTIPEACLHLGKAAISEQVVSPVRVQRAARLIEARNREIEALEANQGQR